MMDRYFDYIANVSVWELGLDSDGGLLPDIVF